MATRLFSDLLSPLAACPVKTYADQGPLNHHAYLLTASTLTSLFPHSDLISVPLGLTSAWVVCHIVEPAVRDCKSSVERLACGDAEADRGVLQQGLEVCLSFIF